MWVRLHESGPRPGSCPERLERSSKDHDASDPAARAASPGRIRRPTHFPSRHGPSCSRQETSRGNFAQRQNFPGPRRRQHAPRCLCRRRESCRLRSCRLRSSQFSVPRLSLSRVSRQSHPAGLLGFLVRSVPTFLTEPQAPPSCLWKRRFRGD